MFIVSKRNFLVRRADCSSYFIRKDFVGEIPQDVYQSGLVQGAIQGGLIAVSDNSEDKILQDAEEKAAKVEAAKDIRPDAKTKAEK